MTTHHEQTNDHSTLRTRPRASTAAVAPGTTGCPPVSSCAPVITFSSQTRAARWLLPSRVPPTQLRPVSSLLYAPRKHQALIRPRCDPAPARPLPAKGLCRRADQPLLAHGVSRRDGNRAQPLKGWDGRAGRVSVEITGVRAGQFGRLRKAVRERSGEGYGEWYGSGLHVGARRPSGCCSWRCTIAPDSPSGRSPHRSTACGSCEALSYRSARPQGRCLLPQLSVLDEGAGQRGRRARLAITATRWMSGGAADGKARRDSGLASLRSGVTALGDRAGINTGLVA